MLTAAVHREMARLVRWIHFIRTRLEEGAESPEIRLLVEAAQQSVSQLASNIRQPEADAVERLKRHLHFIAYYHDRGEHNSYQPDLDDIAQRDLPGVVELVEKWEGSLLSPGLLEAVATSWEAHQYANAVRDAFIYLEQTLRNSGGVPPQEGISGDRLVTRLLGPDSPERLSLSHAEPYSPETRGEAQGALHLFRGAFLLFRNAAAHRFIDYTPEEADEVLRIVNLCLRILGAEREPPFVVRVPAAEATDSLVAAVREIIERHPGPRVVYLQLEAGESGYRLRLSDKYRVADTRSLRDELTELLGIEAVPTS
jgi:hypothetical protein